MSESIKDMFCQPVYERALLSYCFKNINSFYTIISQVSDQDFLRPEHRLVYIILGSLSKSDVNKFDGSMVVNEAQKNNVLQQIGGYDYINAIIGLDLDTDNISYYIEKVLDGSTKYKLYCKLESNLKLLEKDAKNDEITSVDLLGKAGNDVMTLSMQSKAVKEATNLSEGIDEYIEERKDNPIEYCGMSTGFSILDKRIDGLVPATLSVICARPKQGKSAFLSTISTHVAYELFEPVLYVDTEMPFEQWRSRIISMMSGVPERRIKHGGYNDQELYNIKRAVKLIKKGNLYHEYMPGYSIDKLVAVYNKYKHVNDIKLAVFDYIKAPPGIDFRNKKEYQVLGDVTTILKDLAGKLDIPFFAANQINRQQDVADSDRILRYTDVLMFLKPRELKELRKMEEDYGKHRVRNFGTYKLIITDSRRGGTTPSEGIGYNFYKKCLQLSEAEEQIINYESSEYKEKEEFEYDGGDEIQGENVDDSTKDDKFF